MQTDYHIHTKLCKHSNLEITDIIAQRIKEKFTVIGIADHIPYEGILDNQDKNSRMYFKELNHYLAQMKEAKKKYQSQIKLLTGFEAEYLPSQDHYYQKILANKDVDYLILGVHAADDLLPPNDFNINCTTSEQLKRYWKAFKQGMQSGYFIYPVHPDFYMKSYVHWDQHCHKLAIQICDLALELDFPLGFNINGVWKKERKIGTTFRFKYPIEKFWQIARKKGVKIILESDVHDTKQLYDQDIMKEVNKLLIKWDIAHLVIPQLDFRNYWKRNQKT